MSVCDDALADCQCCDGGAELQPLGLPGMEKWQVVCARCSAAGPVCRCESMAVAAWNRTQRALEVWSMLGGMGVGNLG